MFDVRCPFDLATASVWVICLTHDFPSSLVLLSPAEQPLPSPLSVHPAASQPAVFAFADYPAHLADSQSARFL
jgi:hypothetical protein